jgi:hypothetical protein
MAQSQGMPPHGAPMMGGMPKVPAVELTETSAKNAVDAYLTLRDKYGDKVPPANAAQAMAEGLAEAAEVNAVLGGHGFASPEEWQKTITSVALAYGFSKDPKGAADLDKQIAEMQANPQIPAAYKQQAIDSLKGIRPSANNLTVVKGLAADPAYGKKLQALAD